MDLALSFSGERHWISECLLVPSPLAITIASSSSRVTLPPSVPTSLTGLLSVPQMSQVHPYLRTVLLAVPSSRMFFPQIVTGVQVLPQMSPSHRGLPYLLAGLHSIALQALSLPSLKAEGRAQSHRQRHQWFIDGGSHMSEGRSWRDTPPCVADRGQDVVAVFTALGRGRLPVIGELMSHWLIGYQGNQPRGTPLTSPLINYHRGDSPYLND